MIVAATKNKGKVIELMETLKGFEIITMQESGIDEEIEETGKTFEENALIKARFVAAKTNLPVISDDSGLSVDALFGKPGIYSARYAGKNASDARRIEKLLQDMDSAPDKLRTARFTCVIAYIGKDGTEKTFEGECEGVILREPKGKNGFGYDPVFFLPEYGKTFAELSTEIKTKISHRAKALEKLKDYLQNE